MRDLRKRSKIKEATHLLLCSWCPLRAEPHGHIGATKGAVQEDTGRVLS